MADRLLFAGNAREWLERQQQNPGAKSAQKLKDKK
jgi:hypothetical protein